MQKEEPDREHGEDLALVQRLLGGEEAAFDAFAAAYHAPLLRYVVSCLDGDVDRSRELVQTALCKALERLGTYRGEASLFTWLRACCRNEVLMLLRKRSRAPRLVGLDSAEGSASLPESWSRRSDLPEQQLLKAEKRAAVHLALEQLPERYAKALEWKYLEDLPVSDIAQRLDLSPKAAESLLTRARTAFKVRFARVNQPPNDRGLWS